MSSTLSAVKVKDSLGFLLAFLRTLETRCKEIFRVSTGDREVCPEFLQR
jgi:hypothetical protein